MLIGAAACPTRPTRTIGQNFLPNVEPGVRPLVVGAAIFGIVGLVIGIVVAVRGRDGGLRVAAFISAVLLGLIIGAISGDDPRRAGRHRRSAWPCSTSRGSALMAVDVSRTGIDVETLKARFYPTQTIETSKETLEWLQSKMPPGIGS